MTCYFSLSLGTQKSTALDQAVTALVNAGIIMVVSEWSARKEHTWFQSGVEQG
jgi:hypothetical protein